MGERVEVSETISASADDLYDMVSDVTRMGEWSPETTSCRWVRGATGPRVGARFRGDNENGAKRWSITSVVLAAERGEHFAFAPSIGPYQYATWGYEFRPDGDRTVVTEYFEDRRDPVTAWAGKFVSGVSDRATHNRESMTVTLQRLKTAAEAD